MAFDPRAPEAPLPTDSSKRIRLAVIGAVVLLLAVAGWFLFRAVQQEQSGDRWDRLAALRDRWEPKTDPLESDPSGQSLGMRETLLRELEKFLDTDAKAEHDALEPQVRWLIAKTSADILTSMRDVTDFAERSKYYDKAIEQLKILRDRDDFAGYPLNWGTLKPENYASWTRMFLATMELNRAFEEKHFPKDRPPPAGLVVLVRTDRGDLRFGLYTDDAPDETARFLQKAREGRFDGTAIYEKIAKGALDHPDIHALRAGDPATRGAAPYDAKAALAFGKMPQDERLCPDESRNRIPCGRGVLTAWHPEGEEYDETGEFLLVVHRSPSMDYEYTPLGKTLDDASLATLDRCFEGKQWSDDKQVSEQTGEMRDVLDDLQVPIRIVKVLVYRDGNLVEGGDVKPVPEKAAVDESEKTLTTVKPDAYKVAPPPPPAPPPPAAPGAGADKPGEPPADKPGEPPADKPGEPPADKPGEPPAGKPGEPPADKPAGEKPSEPPADKPGEPPADKPGEPPADKPSEGGTAPTDGGR
jgi:cyclophilin family peptidyl-prolyl cis-trans isomerase